MTIARYSVVISFQAISYFNNPSSWLLSSSCSSHCHHHSLGKPV